MPDAPAPLDYATPEKSKQPAWVRWLIWSGIAFFSFVIIAGLIPALIPSIGNRRSDGDRRMCAEHLHQIGLAIVLYATEHGGAYPDSFSTLLLGAPILPHVFVCPASNDEATGAPTSQAMADDLKRSGYVSYRYLGTGLTDKTVLPNQVIAYEPLANHGDGINVLLGDGHAEFVNIARAKEIIDSVTAGKNPVVLLP